MQQEDKDLLLRDLCTRLPYGVKCKYHHIQYIENGEIIDINRFGRVNIDGHIKDVCDIKPYLFPLSSMTEEQKEEYNQSRLKDLRMLNSVLMERISDENNFDRLVVAHNEIDWLNKNHFDYRGLIPMGLANDATGLNIY